MSDEWNKQRLLEVSSSFQECRILLTAAQLDLFTKLEAKPRTVDGLCADEGWSPRGLAILMDALAAQGLLDRSSDGHYRVNSSITGLLVKGSRDSILPLVLHRGTMWETWSHLTRDRPDWYQSGPQRHLVSIYRRHGSLYRGHARHRSSEGGRNRRFDRSEILHEDA